MAMKETSGICSMLRRKLLTNFSFTLLHLLIGSAAARAAESRPAWQVEWEKTMRAAEAEGEVAVYVVDYPRFTVSQFQKAYPRIRLNLVDGPSGPALSSRLMAERRAGKYQADLYIATNAQQARAEEIKSWWDLINPKWKGKIIGYDPSIAGVARNVLWYLYMNKFLGTEFMSKLYGDMQVTLSRDHRQLVDWLASGKAAICVPCDDAELASAKEQRLPVESVTHTLKEGDYIAGGQGVISLIAPAPHPHAAQIFLNWFLSREGQSLYQEYSVKSGQRNANSRRTDIPKDVIAPEYRLKDDSVFWENGPAVDQETAEATKLLKAILTKRP